MESTLNLGFLSIDVGTVFFVLLNTFILLFVLKILLFDKVNAVIEKRGESIAADYKKAEEARADAEKIKSDYDALMSDSKQKADAIIREAQTKASRRSDEIIAQAKTDSEAITEKARTDNELEIKRAKASLKDEIAELAVQVATKIVEHEIKKEQHDKLINEFIETVGEF